MCRREDHPPYPAPRRSVNHSPGFARSAEDEVVRQKTRKQQAEQRQANRRRFLELSRRETIER